MRTHAVVPRQPRTTVLLLLVATLLSATSAHSQVVQVVLREQASGMPLPGAVVRLLRDTTDVAQALTGDAGRVVLRAPGAGSYRIRVNRIGYQATLTEPFQLAPLETVSRELSLVSIPIVLPTVVVRNASRCGGRMDAGSLAATLWEEIRTALTANVLTHRVWAVPLHVQEFEREVDREGGIVHEVTVGSRIVRGPPFGALAAESLATRGFVYDADRDETVFAAPDAALLLSDVFVSTHCFRAVAGRDETVGLEFEPVPGRRTTDVRGTIWVDRASNELRSLDFSYTGLPLDLRRAELGGRVEFQRLPTGAWIVNYWHIRMPRLEIQRGEYRLGHFGQGLPRPISVDSRRVIGYVDHGGRVEIADETKGPIVARALVVGVVFDSTTGQGLARAKVSMYGTPDSAFTDDEGRYRFTTAHGGAQRIVASHHKLGILDDGSVRPVTLSLGDSAVVDFAVPPLRQFARELCGASQNRAGLFGITWDSEGRPQEGLEIRIRWESGADRVREERATSGPGGLYAFCDLPANRDLPVQLVGATHGHPGAVMRGVTALVEEDVRLERGEYRWLDLRSP